MSVQEREARLLPVMGVILVCGFAIMIGSYFIGAYLF
ncbi:MAG: hypothetical protein ACI80L_002600 [Pseudohongiellaceae bacterium]|jgi:hypothetical protein